MHLLHRSFDSSIALIHKLHMLQLPTLKQASSRRADQVSNVYEENEAYYGEDDVSYLPLYLRRDVGSIDDK